jgi:polysaccharide export outer membrane protein
MKTAYSFCFVALLICATAAGAQSAPGTENQGKGGSQAAPSQAVAENDTKYLIGPEDVLNINVWREPELSASVPVRPDGKISLALLNDVQAAGLTPMQLKTEITAALKKYVSEPVVTVVVSGVHSRRVFLVGEVTHTGPVPLLPRMTVLQGIASAGGLTPFANAKKIYVLRNENGAPVKYKFNYHDALKNPSAENIVLRADDTIVVP